MKAPGPYTKEDREKLIAKLRRDLSRFERIPPERREAECADEGEATARAMLRELGVGGGV